MTSKVSNFGVDQYKIKVNSGGEVIIDPGAAGFVKILGNLAVAGATTTINSENLDVTDNIVYINVGEAGAGVSLDVSGIQIDRGTLSDAVILFNENNEWLDPVAGSTVLGNFEFKDTANDLIGIKTNSITTDGEDLYLINSGTGIISVTGTNDYEQQVFVYVNGENTGVPIDDDIVPNVKSIFDFVEQDFKNRIIEGDTKIEISDFSVSGQASKIDVEVDGVNGLTLTETSISLGTVTTFQTSNINDSISLTATGQGTIKISKILEVERVDTVPDAPVSGHSFYVNTPSEGGSGVYYIDEDANTDELISRNRALVFSMVL